MSTEHAADIDHTVLITTGLAAASARYAALGFTPVAAEDACGVPLAVTDA
ncbi:hypothetical protein ACWENR_05855 [Micromonospora sp. NPDC004336]